MAVVFFAGAEKFASIKELLDCGVENVLFSFFYMRKRDEWPKLKELLDANPKVKVFLDSGAFTYSSSKKTSSLPPPEVYHDEYVRFVAANKKYFEYVAELDIDYTWSQEIIEQKAEELWTTGANVVRVWHPNRGMDKWLEYLADPRVKHLGLGSSTNEDVGHQARLVGMAIRAGKTVHGFAMTKLQSTLKSVKFATVDSTTWTAGERFGDLYIFQHNNWTLIGSTQKHRRKLYRLYFKKLGLDPQKVIDDDHKEVRRANIMAWSRMAKRIEIIHRVRSTRDVRDRETGEVLPHEGEREVEVERLAKKVVVKDGRIYIKKNAARGLQEGDVAAATLPKRPAETVVAPPTPPVVQPSGDVQLEPAAQSSLVPATRPTEEDFGFLKAMPKFACSTCAMSADCPEYKEGYICAYTDKFSSFRTRDTTEIRDVMRRVLQQNAMRLQRGFMMEEMVTGGQLDKDVTHLSSLVMSQAKELGEFEHGAHHGLRLTASASGKGVSVLQQLFGRPKPIEKHEGEVIDVTSKKEVSNG